jgi:hypothetical protein
MNADGSNQAYIGTIWFPWRPTWSPDDTKIAFMMYGAYDWPTGVYAINADGTGLVQLGSTDDTTPCFAHKPR